MAHVSPSRYLDENNNIEKSYEPLIFFMKSVDMGGAFLLIAMNVRYHVRLPTPLFVHSV